MVLASTSDEVSAFEFCLRHSDLECQGTGAAQQEHHAQRHLVASEALPLTLVASVEKKAFEKCKKNSMSRRKVVCHVLARGNEQNGENSHREVSSWEKEVRNQVSTSPARILHASSVCAIAFEGLDI